MVSIPIHANVEEDSYGTMKSLAGRAMAELGAERLLTGYLVLYPSAMTTTLAGCKLVFVMLRERL